MSNSKSMIPYDSRNFLKGMVEDLLEYYSRLKTTDAFERKFAEKYEISFDNKIRVLHSIRTHKGSF